MGVCISKAIEEAVSYQPAPSGGVSGGSAPASDQRSVVLDDQSSSPTLADSGEVKSTPSPVLELENAEGRRTRHGNSRLRAQIEKRRSDELKTNIVHIEDPSGRPIEEVYDGVHTGHKLGEGVMGVVRLVTHKDTGVKYAVKCLDLKHLKTESGLQQICEEICIMCELDHPNIARLEEVYESPSKIYLVQELCRGRDLFDRLDEQHDGYFTEDRCIRLVREILCSVRYLHSKGIIHRDLKLENFVFSSEDPESDLKMIDFGFSKHFCSGEILTEAAGTPYTISPEIIRGSYDERSDIWAVGVISYLLLSGYPPFGSCDIESCLGGCNNRGCKQIVRSNILCGSFSFDPKDIWSEVSPQARDFVRSLLVTNPSTRPTAEEAQRHEWLRRQALQEIDVCEDRLDPNVVSCLVEFKDYSESQRLLREVLSFAILPEQTKHLQREFEKLDMDDMGEVSLAALKHALGEKGIAEEEIENIFNVMRISKTETRIHWHEFIAASLSQCQIDNRNLKLFFERVDQEHKGYITFDDCIKVFGKDAGQHIDAMKRMWGESKCSFHCERITFADWLRIAPRAQ